MQSRQTIRQQSQADGMVRDLREAIVTKLAYALGTTPDMATDREWYAAVALTARDRAVDVWMQSARNATQRKAKRVYYLSIEFLLGKLLIDTLGNLNPDVTAIAGQPDAGFDPAFLVTHPAAAAVDSDRISVLLLRR